MPPFNLSIPSHDGKAFGAYVALATVSPAPVLIVIQEIFGVNAGMRAMCDGWAKAGYHAICPDLFWRQQEGVELTDKTPEEWGEAMKYFTGFDTPLGVEDLKSTLAVARRLEGANGKVASIGFCLGGKLAFLMASRSDADCNISYYGVGLSELLNEVPNIRRPLLLHFAERDKYLSGDTLAEVRGALAKNSMTEQYVYPGVEHAFARINGEHFDASAATLAGQRSADFLAKYLR